MPEPTIIDLKDCVIKFVDGTTPTPVELEIEIGEGTFTHTRRWDREYRRNRGLLNKVKDLDDQPMEVSITAEFTKIRSDTGTGEAMSIVEFVERENQGTVLISTDPDVCAPFAFDILIERTNDCGTVLDEVITFPQFRPDEMGGDWDAGTFSITGRCNVVKPTSIRTALP